MIELRRWRQTARLKKVLLPVKRGPYSTLHTPGKLPYWMKDQAILGVKPGAAVLALDVRNVVRVLQDTGHDLWLFISSEGLEIRSFYSVPNHLVVGRLKKTKTFYEPFAGQYEALRYDFIDWSEILPELNLSSHQRIQRSRTISNIPDRSRSEKDADQATSVTIVQDTPGSVFVDLGPVRLSLTLKPDGATEIKALANEHCAMCGYRHLGVMAMSLEANRLTRLHQRLSISKKIKHAIVRHFAGTGRKAPSLIR